MIRQLWKSPSLSEAGFSVLTVFLALIVGGLAMAFTGANPLSIYKDLVVGAGFDWPFHLIPGNPLGVEPLLAENNLVSTLVQFTPLVLTGLAVAFAFRCGLFNIGGTGQFWVGSVCALIVAQHVGGPTGCSRRPRGGDRRRDLGRHRGRAQGLPRGARGDHDDHAQLDRDLHDAVPVRRQRAAHGQLDRQRRLQDHQDLGAVPGHVGRRPADPHRDLRRARVRRHLLRRPQPHDARLRGARGRLQPRGGALRRHLGQALDDRRRWRSAARSQASRARSRCWA